MEQSGKIKLFVISAIILLVGEYSYAIDLATPHDVLTLEALIALHKEMKKNEDLSLTQVATVVAEQEITTDLSNKWSDVKQTINSKINDVNSYMLFVSSVVNVTNKLKSLISEYNDYISDIGPIVLDKPYCAENYSAVNIKLGKEVSRLSKAIVNFTLNYSIPGASFFAASMDEKMQIIYNIDSIVTNMRSMINSSSNYIRYANWYNFKPISAFELEPDDIRKKNCQELINRWNNHKNL